MGKKNRNKRNRLQKLQTFVSNPGCRWSIAVLDARKELELELERNDDIISSMPDDVLSHVISFLPFESAVQTSFLSTRWRNVWKSNFSQWKGSIRDAFAEISSFLDGCSDQYSEQRPVSDWGFIFHLGKHSFISVAGDPYKALQLDFSNVNHEFPKRFDWTLDVGGPKHLDYWPFYDRFDDNQFKIRTLHLKSVSYIFSGPISSMMINFTFLKNLKIENCHGLRSLKLDAGIRSRLKNLTILDCQHLESLHIKHLRLDSLRFRGKLLSFKGVNGGSSRFWWRRSRYNDFELVDAMLDFREGPGSTSTKTCGLDSFFSAIANHVKSLIMSGWIFEPIIYPMLQSFPFSFNLKLKCLTELWWIDYAKDKFKFNSNPLIAFLKICPRLTRLYITIDPKSYRRTNTISNYLVDFSSVSRLEDLKVVKLEGFQNEKEEIILAKRLKEEFHVEPLIIAKSNYLNCVRLMVKADDVYDQLKVGEDSYKFIEKRVEQLHDLCPKHLHMRI